MPMNEEPSAFERNLDAIIKGMERLGDRVETIERKSTGDNQNVVRNPNFRRNQNQNIGKNVPDQNIRPPFQENFVEGSTSEEPTKDVEIKNVTEDKNEPEFFLSQDDQENHIIETFQTHLGETFDFKEGYDTSIMRSINSTI